MRESPDHWIPTRLKASCTKGTCPCECNSLWTLWIRVDPLQSLSTFISRILGKEIWTGKGHPLYTYFTTENFKDIRRVKMGRWNYFIFTVFSPTSELWVCLLRSHQLAWIGVLRVGVFHYFQGKHLASSEVSLKGCNDKRTQCLQCGGQWKPQIKFPLHLLSFPQQ